MAGRNRVVPTMSVPAAGFAFLLYVADFTAGGDLAIAPDDATAAQCGEAEKANETHDTTLAGFSSKLCTAECAAIWICEIANLWNVLSDHDVVWSVAGAGIS
jgi:hypothetical protein